MDVKKEVLRSSARCSNLVAQFNQRRMCPTDPGRIGVPLSMTLWTSPAEAVVPDPLEADDNQNGPVEIGDLNLVLFNWNASDASWVCPVTCAHVVSYLGYGVAALARSG